MLKETNLESAALGVNIRDPKHDDASAQVVI